MGQVVHGFITHSGGNVKTPWVNASWWLVRNITCKISHPAVGRSYLFAPSSSPEVAIHGSTRYVTLRSHLSANQRARLTNAHHYPRYIIGYLGVHGGVAFCQSNKSKNCCGHGKADSETLKTFTQSVECILVTYARAVCHKAWCIIVYS